MVAQNYNIFFDRTLLLFIKQSGRKSNNAFTPHPHSFNTCNLEEIVISQCISKIYCLGLQCHFLWDALSNFPDSTEFWLQCLPYYPVYPSCWDRQELCFIKLASLGTALSKTVGFPKYFLNRYMNRQHGLVHIMAQIPPFPH